MKIIDIEKKYANNKDLFSIDWCLLIEEKDLIGMTRTEIHHLAQYYKKAYVITKHTGKLKAIKYFRKSHEINKKILIDGNFSNIYNSFGDGMYVLSIDNYDDHNYEYTPSKKLCLLDYEGVYYKSHNDRVNEILLPLGGSVIVKDIIDNQDKLNNIIKRKEVK